MNPDDVLAEWERLAQEATEGSWSLVLAWDSTHGTNYGVDTHTDDDLWPVMRGGIEEDAAFIAAARTAWPAATAALRAVLDLHRPDPANGTTWCRRCGEAWPCATASAVNDALGGQG